MIATIEGSPSVAAVKIPVNLSLDRNCYDSYRPYTRGELITPHQQVVGHIILGCYIAALVALAIGWLVYLSRVMRAKRSGVYEIQAETPKEAV